jgi:hypothetical protein
MHGGCTGPPFPEVHVVVCESSPVPATAPCTMTFANSAPVKRLSACSLNTEAPASLARATTKRVLEAVSITGVLIIPTRTPGEIVTGAPSDMLHSAAWGVSASARIRRPHQRSRPSLNTPMGTPARAQCGVRVAQPVVCEPASDRRISQRAPAPAGQRRKEWVDLRRRSNRRSGEYRPLESVRLLGGRFEKMSENVTKWMH